ncbi:zona pellucida sperm-binding protein 3-like [Genypterus blacodes]|uniref:zona pellucida sperm-binding protein 3-like n=1 Tax=Genypterus blacodes TaxID=154954 RepID=UPI003F76D591
MKVFTIIIFLSVLCVTLAAPSPWQDPDQDPVWGPGPPVRQEQQSFQEPLTWKFPAPPAEEEPRFPPEFQLTTRAPVDSVSAVCGEDRVRVEVKKDLLGLGREVQATELSLGGCPASSQDQHNFLFESELHTCGSHLLMSDDSFIYVFKLIYSPSRLTSIVRSQDATVDIQCHYLSRGAVSSELLRPTWASFSDTKGSQENLMFSLRLMTDDWQFVRPSHHFLLGDMMRFEASVRLFQHAPLRMTVESCVATAAPNIDALPRYAFLENYGCLFDSQLTASSSRFLPRSQENRLQFEVEAFMFQRDDGAEFTDSIYIHCRLRATPTGPADHLNKACYFSNGWREAGGTHEVCSCCDTSCGTDSDAQWTLEKAVGPIRVTGRPLH